MKSKQPRTIFVFADWQGKQPALMGRLKGTYVRGKEIFSFEYDTQWLNNGHTLQIDPDMQLYAGTQYLNDDKSNFGVFLDSSPDRLGRLLMRRREAVIARQEGRNAETLFETDYLLGVFDGHRMGALRFKEQEDGAFLNDNKELATPPWTSLRELEHASLQLEREDITEDPDYVKWLNMLVAPGSSLGGARPKASVTDEHGKLWIAKFPSRNDDRDIGAWEMVAHDLAKNAGINMAEGKCSRFYSKQHTFLTKRFDRTQNGERIHFASAMTLLGYTDGADFQDGASYLEMAEFIMRNGAQVNADLEELWRRIVFNICVKNTDDHLRNHGFLLAEGGWILSPAYDINPVPVGTGLKLNISEQDNALDLDLAREVIDYFRVDKKRSETIIKQVITAVKDWKRPAEHYKIAGTDQETMAAAFWS